MTKFYQAKEGRKAHYSRCIYLFFVYYYHLLQQDTYCDTSRNKSTHSKTDMSNKKNINLLILVFTLFTLLKKTASNPFKNSVLVLTDKLLGNRLWHEVVLTTQTPFSLQISN